MSKKKKDKKNETNIDYNELYKKESKKIKKEWEEIRLMKIKKNKEGYDQRYVNECIDNFSRYRELIGSGDDGMIVINNISGPEFLKCVKELQKMIKHLKLGKCNKVYDKSQYNNIIRDRYERR